MAVNLGQAMLDQIIENAFCILVWLFGVRSFFEHYSKLIYHYMQIVL